MGHIPAYKIMYEKLKIDIDNNVYPVNSFLPPEGELEKIFSVSRTTVRHAIDLLVREGKIRVKQGFGTQVVDLRGPDLPHYSKFHNVVNIQTELIGDGRTHHKGSWIDKVKAPAKAAAFLEVPENAEVFCIQRVLYTSDKPFVLMTNYLRTDFFPNLDTYRDQFTDLYFFLKEQYGVSLEKGTERIRAVKADFVDAQLLDLTPGSPIFLTERFATCQLGPMEYLESKIRPDLCTFVVDMEGQPSWYMDASYTHVLEKT